MDQPDTEIEQWRVCVGPVDDPERYTMSVRVEVALAEERPDKVLKTLLRVAAKRMVPARA